MPDDVTVSPASAQLAGGPLPSTPITRRLGVPPSSRGSVTDCTCPDIFELEDGNFAVIGTDRTLELRSTLPSDAGLAAYERIVVISRQTLLSAKGDIPDA
ncbi:hypothetical protein [Spirilliplanes yamanashiensis]|uniref:Uncharacterized protein n=1 Tax=Spirilliplanes yamanashiensis TaxID=42233 RepID=A0A8J3Y4W5_9ACTN|nr:hypothetical protein [Spirilliplanes yamanashiensis]MDP9819355.1 hypothetical protein [Spirilliplanes yamanashiensis]GIJ01821.1 hypothetical protein Sya03_11730 [Spirilliplanes yamanashiensis]